MDWKDKLNSLFPDPDLRRRIKMKLLLQPDGIRADIFDDHDDVVRSSLLTLLEHADSAAGQTTPEQDDRLQKLLEGFVQMMIERFEVVARKKSYRISEANSTVFQEIQSSGGVEEIENEPDGIRADIFDDHDDVVRSSLRTLLEHADSAAGQATPEQDDRLQKLLEGFVQMMIERFEVVARKKSYRISEANSTVFQEIQSSGGVEEIENVEVLFDARKHKACDVPIFKWGDGVESGQAAGYVKYVE